MADELTEEQIKKVREALEGTTKSFQKAQEEFGKTLGRQAVQFTNSLYKGEQGASQFGNAIESAATALQTLILAIPGLGVAAKVATVAMGLMAKGINQVTKQSDDLYKAYQDLSRAGAATAGGMTEVFANMQKFGYGIEELDKMAALVRENSKALGLFVGTVGQGSRQLADTAESIQRSGIQREFLNMGMKVDDINKGIAGYIVQQGRLGKLQAMTQAEINAGARAYIKEMEILTRLTGQTREEMEQQRESANAIDQFYATVEEMGPAGDELYKVFNQLMAVDPAKAKGFAESVSGFMGFSEEQNRLYMATGGALMQNVDALKNGSMNAAQFLNSLGGAINQNKDMLRSFAKIGAEEFGNFYSNTKLGQKDFEKAVQDAAASLKPIDGVTDSATGLRQEQMRARDSLQSLVNLGVKPATDALSGLAKVASGGASILPGRPGGSAGPIGGPIFGSASTRAAMGDVDRILSTIRQRESGGNYMAQAPGSTASGAYQFIDKTWQNLTKKFGVGQEFASAKMAPKEIQDAVAKAYVQDILKRAGGDVSKVPLEWYTGNLQGTMTPEQLRANRGLTSEMYQSKWMQEFQKTSSMPAQMAAEEPGWVSMLAGKLDELNRTQRDQLGVQQKQLQVAS